MAKGLTPKQERFVQEYLVDSNATQAAIRAGYSAKTVNANVTRLMVNDGVKSALSAARQKLMGRTEVTAARVITELARIAFLDPRKVVKWGPDGVTPVDSDALSPDDAAAVAEVSQTVTQAGGSVKVKLADKVAALDKLGKHLGLWKDAVDLSGTVRLEIVEEIIDGLPPDRAPPGATPPQAG